MIKTGTTHTEEYMLEKSSSFYFCKMIEKSIIQFLLTNQFNNNAGLKRDFFKFLLLLLLIACPFAGTNNGCYAQKLTGVTPYDTSKALIHSPRKASFYSAVLPGLGQVYNKKYWKVPIIYAGIFALVYSINYNNNYYSKFKKAYIYRMDNDPNTNAEFIYLGKSTINITDNSRLLEAMDYFKRYRDLSILGLAGLYVLNIIDATVDAYLFDYDVSQNLSIKVKPTLINSPNSVNVGLSCSLRF